jgi:hypothetical protein
MNNQQVKNQLRAAHDPFERDYRPRPLPLTIEAQRRRQPRLADHLRVAGAGLAGAATALLAVAVVGAYTSGRDGVSLGAPGDTAGGSCQTSAFDIGVEPWAEAPMAGGVLLTFQAHSDTDCVIDRGLHAMVFDANGTALVESAVGVRETITVTPGSVWRAGVSWSSYCGTAGDTVAAPPSAARPLQLAAAFGVAGEIEGEEVTLGGEIAPLEVAGEVAPEPCDEQFPGSPFILLPTEVTASGPSR